MQILSNEERRSNFDRYGQMDENQPFGQSQHHGFRSFHNSFYFDESFFHFPRYAIFRFVVYHLYSVFLSVLFLVRQYQKTLMGVSDSLRLKGIVPISHVCEVVLDFLPVC